MTLDFGDESDPVSLTISSTRAETTHIYTTAGQFTITATYSGDANFAPATKSLTAVSILSSPAYTLHLFGDSLSARQPGWWPALLTGVVGWPQDNHACGGCSTPDMVPAIYNSIVDEHYASTWLLGQNQGPGPQFEHATLAENAWLAIPEGPAKLRAQNGAVTRSGSWTASDLFPTLGLRSSAAGSALTASISGSTIYVGLSAKTSTDFTVDILIDGVDQGTASPVAGAGRYYSTDAYGLRYVVGGSADSTHVVQIVCQNPGTSGCYVDWIGSNGAAKRPNLPPYVWTGVSYTTLQPVPVDGFLKKQQEVRAIVSELESDGLPIRVADIASVFNMPATPECSGDGVHPNLCGNQIEESVWLSAMSFLATEAQRIDVGQNSQLVVGVPLTLQATATSGLPLKYSIISGDATVSGNQLTTQKLGNVVVEADQEGDSTVLPAAPVQFSLTAVLPTTTSLFSSVPSANPGASVTLTATVTSNGSPVSSGVVTFFSDTTSLGSSAVNGNGIAILTTTALPVGTDTVTGSYAGTAQFPRSVSTPVSIQINPSSAAITSPGPGSTLASSSATFTWTAGTGVSGYFLWVGTTFGGHDLVNIGQLSLTSATVNLPTNGASIYVRLWSVVNGKPSKYSDYTYKEANISPAAMTSPLNGSTLASSSATFTWTAGTGVSGYFLWVGTTFGGHDLVNIGQLGLTSATVNLPTNGAPIYVRLWSVVNGKPSKYSDYTYKEANVSPAAMTSPLNGSTLASSSATFTWTAGSGVSGYFLWVGTTFGGHDLVNIGQQSLTSVTVNLPTNGAPIYVRLWSVVNGKPSKYSDYTYKEWGVNSVAHSFSGVTLFGDSVIHGAGATTYSKGANALLLSAMGGGSDYTQNGDTSADVSWKALSHAAQPDYFGQSPFISQVGGNDLGLVCGNSTPCQANMLWMEQAAYIYLLTAKRYQIYFASNAEPVTTTGTWTTDNTTFAPSNAALSTVVNGSSVTFTTSIPSKSVAIAWYGNRADTAVGALSCDGGATSDTLPAQGNTTIAEQNGVHPTAFAKIETFATNTTHTCTVTASASVGNPFELIYAAVPPPATNATYGSWTANGPYGFIGGAPYVQNGLYTNQLNSLDALTQQLVATLHSAGWTNVQYVNLRNYLNGTTDYASVPVTLPNGLTCPASTAPPLHPNDCGHQHLFDAYMATIQPIAPVE